MALSERVSRWMASAWSAPRCQQANAQPSPTVALPDVAQVRQAMHLAMQPCSGAHRAVAAGQIERAHTVMDLWLLRATLYQSLAQDLGEAEATRRMAALLPVFKDAIPGGVRHFGDNSRHGQRFH